MWLNGESYRKISVEVKWEIWILLEMHEKIYAEWYAETTVTMEKTFQWTTVIQYPRKHSPVQPIHWEL